jgi:hypothetical protein
VAEEGAEKYFYYYLDENHIINGNFVDFMNCLLLYKVPEKVDLHGIFKMAEFFQIFPASLAGKFQNNLATVTAVFNFISLSKIFPQIQIFFLQISRDTKIYVNHISILSSPFFPRMATEILNWALLSLNHSIQSWYL